MKKGILILFCFITALFSLRAQPVECGKIKAFLDQAVVKIEKLNTEDPDLIPLHYFLMLDIQQELQNFSTQTIPQLNQCPELDFYTTVKTFDDISFAASIKREKLEQLHNKVDSLFYEKATIEIYHGNQNNALYYLNRALQYNRINPDALILKCKLSFEEENYDECLDLLQVLYHEAPLDRKHEITISDFNLMFYDRIYRNADSLIRIEKASEALELFTVLESFCLNMPSDYCNDDYYHGILKSKKGVYDSYLLIANVAKERGFTELQDKFLAYANEYKQENAEELLQSMNYHSDDPPVNINPVNESTSSISGNTEKLTVSLTQKGPETIVVTQEKTVSPDKISDTAMNTGKGRNRNPPSTRVVKNQSDKETATIPVQNSLSEKESQQELYSKEKEIEYYKLLLDCIDHCMKDEFKAAYEDIKKARELESCQCFPVDYRTEMLYDTLSKTFSN